MKFFKYAMSLCTMLLMLACSDNGSSSENTDEPDPKPQGASELTVDRTRIADNGKDKATFTVTCQGQDVSADSKFYVVGGKVTMTNNEFSTTEKGVYEVYANYDNLNTEKIKITVAGEVENIPEDPEPDNTVFTCRSLVLQFTGSQCGFCPNMIEAIDDLLASEEYSEKVEHVAVHSYNSSDPLYFKDGAAFSQAMSVSGYPHVLVNMNTFKRTNNNGTPGKNLIAVQNLVDDVWTKHANAGICASNTIKDNVLTASIEIKAAVADNYRVGVMVLENGVEGSQTGMTGIIEHINALRAITGHRSTYNYSGDEIGLVGKGEKGSIAVDVNIDPDEWNLDNCHLLIYVTAPDVPGSSLYTIKNVVKCPINGEVVYNYTE